MTIEGYKTAQQIEQESYDKAVKAAQAERERILTTVVDSINAIRWEEMDNEEKKAWKDYRKDLLDITEQAGYPLDITWPTKPGEG